MIMATVEHQSGALRELVGAGADLNLQNEVRSVTVDTTSCSIPIVSCLDPPLKGKGLVTIVLYRASSVC